MRATSKQSMPSCAALRRLHGREELQAHECSNATVQHGLCRLALHLEPCAELAHTTLTRKARQVAELVANSQIFAGSDVYPTDLSSWSSFASSSGFDAATQRMSLPCVGRSQGKSRSPPVSTSSGIWHKNKRWMSLPLS